MSSVDYKAFVQAETEEHLRYADVYQGVSDEDSPAVEHLMIDHLSRLLSEPLTLELRSLCLKEYDDIRAYIRAMAISGLPRKDFYDEASREELLDAQYLAMSLAANQFMSDALLSTLDDEVRAKLETIGSEYQDRKTQSEARAKEQGDIPGSYKLTDKDMVRIAMKGVSGVNSRGVSTSQKRVL